MKWDRSLLKKILYIAIIIAVAPFALEIVLLADVAGVEFAVFFLAFYLKSAAYRVYERWLSFKYEVLAVLSLLAELYFFRPRILSSHVAASCVLLVFTSSAVFCCLMWLPPMLLSSSGFS